MELDFDLENPLTNSSYELNPEKFALLFLIESEHMPSQTYITSLQLGTSFDINIRRQVVSSILQLSFDPFLSYLGVNYLDRFMSCQTLTLSKPWVRRLTAVSCVSVAAKMLKLDFSTTNHNLEGDGEVLMFDSRTIRRMEVLILGALKWRMRSITPFSFIALFTSFFKLKDPPLRQALKARAIEIILEAQNDVGLMEYKPSIISASALLSASHELFPLQSPCYMEAICNCSYVNKDNLVRCYNAMQDVVMEGYGSVYDSISRLDTPINVLDHQFSTSDDSERTSGAAIAAATTTTIITTNTTTTTALPSVKNLKRRKVSDHCINHNVQLSQFQQC